MRILKGIQRGAELAHDVRHLRRAGFALVLESQQALGVEAELLAQLLQLIQQRQPLRLVIRRHFANQHRRVDGILIAHGRAGQVAIAFLEAEDVALGVAFLFQQPNLLADELEAGEHVAQLHAVLLANRHSHLGGHDGLDGDGRQFALLRLAVAAHIVQQQHAHVVAGNQRDGIALPHTRADAVAVGVGGDAHIRPGGDGLFNRQLHRLADFGVRVRAGREMAVGHFLLRDDIHVDIAHALQHFAHRHIARAVERAVDDVQALVGGGDAQAVNHLVIALNGFVVDVADHAVIEVLLEARQGGLERLFGADEGIDAVGGFNRNLAAIRAIDLIAVEFRGIMACRHHHARAGVQVAHSVGQHGGRHERAVEVDADAHFRQRRGGQLGKIAAMDAAVAADGAGRLLARLQQVTSQPARRLGHGVEVHAVFARA